MHIRVGLPLLFSAVLALPACGASEPPPKEEEPKALRREIERPLDRAHEAEAATKAQAEQNNKALEEAVGE